MEKVHVFISTGRFRSFTDMRAFIDKTYTEDGDGVPSQFIREVGLSAYEPETEKGSRLISVAGDSRIDWK